MRRGGALALGAGRVRMMGAGDGRSDGMDHPPASWRPLRLATQPGQTQAAPLLAAHCSSTSGTATCYVVGEIEENEIILGAVLQGFTRRSRRCSASWIRRPSWRTSTSPLLLAADLQTKRQTEGGPRSNARAPTPSPMRRGGVLAVAALACLAGAARAGESNHKVRPGNRRAPAPPRAPGPRREGGGGAEGGVSRARGLVWRGGTGGRPGFGLVVWRGGGAARKLEGDPHRPIDRPPPPSS